MWESEPKTECFRTGTCFWLEREKEGSSERKYILLRMEKQAVSWPTPPGSERDTTNDFTGPQA